MTNSLSIAVVGAGAIGSAVAFSLARAGFAPKLVARGETLAAIRRNGLHVEKWDGGGVVRLDVTDDPAELGPQDLVIGTMKAQDWPAGLAALTPLIGPQSALLPPINGVPWWYFDGQPGPLGGERIAAVDPDGALLAALPARSVIGAVVYMGVARTAPGVVRWTSGNKFVLGEALGARCERTEQVAAVLRHSGFDVTVTDDIRGEIWTKLIGNAAFNPLSVIARARIDELMNDAGLGRVALRVMHEVAAVAAAAGAPSGMDIEKRFAINAELGAFRTSMLQDYEAGRALELGGLVDAVVEIGSRLGVETPMTRLSAPSLAEQPRSGTALHKLSPRFSMPEDINAFVPGPRAHIEGSAGGPLAGLTFAAKDLFDVAGFRTGGGNPDWARSNPVPTRHAWAVQRLLDAGATLIGKTITDEVSLGIVGENAFYGTPLNSRAPDRVPGGSSSGSAAAVAAGLCDTALGTDTGGSVRVPASFCGLYGIRPTHGRIDVSGMMPQAPSSDTTGWLARDIDTFARVSSVMLDEAIATSLPRRLIVAVDAFAFADPEVGAALRPMVHRLSALIGDTREEVMAPGGITQWARAQRTLQPSEAWLTFKDWIDRDNPRFAFSVARNLILGSMIPESERGWAQLVRQEARGRMRYLLPEGTMLCLPTTPFPAPKRGEPLSAAAQQRDRLLCLCCHGGLTGVPQISIPGSTVDGLPIGLSIVGGPGSDAALIAVAAALAR